jgi:hypothetical protein
MLASKVHWNVNYKSWEEFPPFQKYLALGETVAHLNLLKQKGLVKRNKVPISQELNKSLYVYSML